MRDAVPCPVTVKIRKGWDKGSVNAVEFARMAEQCGAAAVCVHGRTRAQFYSGRADWQIIRDVKNAISIPVIANGDVFEPEDAARIRQTVTDILDGEDGLKDGIISCTKPTPAQQEIIEAQLAAYGYIPVMQEDGTIIYINEQTEFIAYEE